MRAASLELRLELHERLWRGQMWRPLLGFFLEAPQRRFAGPAYPSIDAHLSVRDVLAKYRAHAAWAASEPGDRVPSVAVTYGTPLLPALAGSGYRDDGHTAWAIPTGLSAESLKVPRLDPDLPFWGGYADKVRALAESAPQGVIVSTEPMAGPVEMLLGLLGPEQLLTDMFDAPEAVKARTAECLQLWKDVFDGGWELLGRPAGHVGFGVYLSGRSHLWSEDALALVGPRQFGEFFRGPIAAVAAHLDTCLLHTHSAGLSSTHMLSAIPELDGVEISNDPNGPPLEAIVRLGVWLQGAGKAVMFSNWLRPLSEKQVDYILDCVDPARSFITLTVRDEAEAAYYVDKVAKRFGRTAAGGHGAPAALDWPESQG
jgi:hypothetical protein